MWRDDKLLSVCGAVDDMPTNRKTLSRVMEQLGWETIVAADGLEVPLHGAWPHARRRDRAGAGPSAGLLAAAGVHGPTHAGELVGWLVDSLAGCLS